MDKTSETATPLRFIDRAPIVDDIVTITPGSGILFDVIALDEPGAIHPMVYVRQHAGGDDAPPAKWVFLTYVKVVDDEDPNAWS